MAAQLRGATPSYGESLKMTAERVLPYYHAHIEPELRALVMHIETLFPEGIIHREIPTGPPIVYTFSLDMILENATVLD